MASTRLPSHREQHSAARAILRAALSCVLFSFLSIAHAAKVEVEIEGLEDDLRDAALANLQLRDYEERDDVTASQVRRLFDQAEQEIRTALEPFGYYQVDVDGDLNRTEEGDFRASFTVDLNEPVIVREVHLQVQGSAPELDTVQTAIKSFQPRVGERLDHAVYESSKGAISSALESVGYLQSKLVTSRVEVTRSANSAEIFLEWQPGERLRFGEVRFGDAPYFSDEFLRRYIPWRGETFYAPEHVLELQQRLVDAGYFSAVSVQPNVEDARDGYVPVDVLLLLAKQDLYTAELYVSTDSGPGGRLGFERRYLNRSGHKLSADLEYSQRLQEISTLYQIPRPGVRNRVYTIGAGYRDEETETSTSRTARVAANQVTERWRGFTRTLGLQFLKGDFEVADQQGSSTLVYAEGLLTRRKADDLLFARRGYSLLYGLRVAPENSLSDTSFVQARAEAKWIRGVGDDGRFITRAALGGMWVDDFNLLPPELRFFAGGDRSVRGFDYQAIGETNDAGGVVGGEYLATFSVEYEHYFLENWGAAIFTDAGDAFSDEFNTNVGAGIGLRWRSPVGLVRLDIAKPVVSDLEDEWRIHFVIGPDL
jgi:translocation and assembly module TamA